MKPAFMEMEVGFLCIVFTYLMSVVRYVKIVIAWGENEVVCMGGVRV